MDGNKKSLVTNIKVNTKIKVSLVLICARPFEDKEDGEILFTYVIVAMYFTNIEGLYYVYKHS